jgi:mannose-6-phosphate isomerase-like protein (cupin superfamily)
MMGEPMGSPREARVFEPGTQASADGDSFCIRDWRGSGPPSLHVHHADDEAWHVLEGTLRFQLGGRTEDVSAGATVFVPAGVPHTYEALPGSRYLLVLTPRLRDLIGELQTNRDPAAQADIYSRYQSKLLNP